MIQHSRKPAVAVLLVTAVVAVAYVSATAVGARTQKGPTLAQLERAIADPDASTDLWLAYAQRLEEEKRFAHAAMAYERVLEKDPYSRTANIECASALSRARDSDRFYCFMTSVLSLEPRLALDILGRPEVPPFLREERFQELLNQARVQSMD